MTPEEVEKMKSASKGPAKPPRAARKPGKQQVGGWMYGACSISRYLVPSRPGAPVRAQFISCIGHPFPLTLCAQSSELRALLRQQKKASKMSGRPPSRGMDEMEIQVRSRCMSPMPSILARDGAQVPHLLA